MTITGTEAYEAMRTHHRILGEQLGQRVSAVTAAAAAGQPHEAAVAGLIAYLAGEILPHAAAEEATIYPAAAGLDGLAGTVSEMTAEHKILSDAAGRLAEPAAAADAVRRAEEIARLFAAHVAKADTPLSESAIVGAAAGAALREPGPDPAVRVPAALHGPARHAGSAPAQEGSADGGPAAGSPASDPDLDVRDMPPARRHESIFAAWQALAPGAGFVLVNDHDPKPLRYQFEAEHPGQFTWDYIEAGPQTWRVRIGRPLAVTPSGAGETGGAEPAGEDGGRGPALGVRAPAPRARPRATVHPRPGLPPGRGGGGG